MHLPLITLALLPAALATPTSSSNRPSPLLKSRSTTTSIPGKYIVKFKDTTIDISLNSVLTSHKPDHVFRAPGFRGFSASLDATSLATIRALPDVEFVEEDSIVSINGVIAQEGAPWNLARLSSRTRTPGEDTYRYEESAGAGTCVYVVDTGVDGTHPELAGRVVWGVNTAGDNMSADENGHGTAVAGVTAGIIHGVAKRSTVVVVKVLNAGGSGTT
jgi:subtilisin family serine protease